MAPSLPASIPLEVALQALLAVGAAGTWLYDNVKTKSHERMARTIEILRHYETLPGRNEDVLAAIRKQVDGELQQRFLKREGIDWEQVQTGLLVSAIGFALGWIFLYFRAGPELSFWRLLGGMFFGLGWGLVSLILVVGKLFRKL